MDRTKKAVVKFTLDIGIHVFFYKHMKFQNRAQLFLAVFDFKAHIMLNFSRYLAIGKEKI